jgi:hypothetical protein
MPKKDVDSNILDSQTKDFALRQTKIRDVVKYGIAATGQALYIKSLEQKRLSASQAIRAKCYDCMAYFEDGKGDCGDPLCPLYDWMPYGQVKMHPAHANRTMPEKNSYAPDGLYPPKSGNMHNEAEVRS